MSENRFNLQKGDRFNVTKESNGDTRFYIGLSWEEPEMTRSGVTFDCDASAIACHSVPYKTNPMKLVSDSHFVFFNNLQSEDNAIIHSGDALTGAGDDTEQIRIFMDRLDPRVELISIFVTIHDAIRKKQNFGKVKNCSVRVAQMDDLGNPTTELFKYNLSGDYSGYTAVQFGDFYRENGAWNWHNQAHGMPNIELTDIINLYDQTKP